MVLDDLGAELGIKNKVSTDFNNDILNRILEARQNKATILLLIFLENNWWSIWNTHYFSSNEARQWLCFQYKDTTDKRMRSVK